MLCGQAGNMQFAREKQLLPVRYVSGHFPLLKKSCVMLPNAMAFVEYYVSFSAELYCCQKGVV